MIQSLSIIGGDTRIVKLATLLQQDKWNITTYGLEKAELSCPQASTLEQALQENSYWISGVPFSSNGITVSTPWSEKNIPIEALVSQAKGHTLLAGKIPATLAEKIQQQGGKTIDILQQEAYTIYNTIPTAEGAIQVAMEHTETTLARHKGNGIRVW